MSIPVQCKCGQSLRARAETANQRIVCPRCGTALRVPVPELETLLDVPTLTGPPFMPRPTGSDPTVPARPAQGPVASGLSGRG
jgi:hypothetical protein